MEHAPRRLLNEVVALAWPAMLQGLVTTLVLFTDRLFLGRYATEALGSLGVAGTLLWSVFAVFGAYSAGIVAVIGRAIGANQGERARDTLRAVLGFAALVGLVVGVLGWAVRWPLTELLASGPETSRAMQAMAADYMGIVFMVAPLHFVATAAATSLQASGDTRTPMLIGVAAGALNLVMTWLLVYGHAGLPELGVRGAAVGTASAFALQSTLMLLVLRRRSGALRLEARSLHEPGQAPASASMASGPLRAVLRISGPAFGERVLYHSAYMVFTALIGHLGDVAMAAHQSLIAVEAISFVAAEGIGVAAGALVAQKLGAGQPEQAAGAGQLAALMGALALTMVSVVFLVWPRQCIGMFTDDPQVLALGAMCLRVAAVAQPLMAITDALAGALRGAGDTKTPMHAALVGPVMVRLGVCSILAYPAGLGLLGIWIGSTLDWLVRAVWLVRAFRARRWLRDHTDIGQHAHDGQRDSG